MRPNRRERISTTLAIALALALVVGVLSLEGLTAAAVPIVFALVLTLPGNLVRRWVRPSWSLGVVESIAVDLVGSCVLLVMFGGLLAAFGKLTRGPVIGLGGVALVGLAYLASRGSGSQDGMAVTVRAIALLVGIGAAGLCVFHIDPLVGDRIFLGQLRTSVEVIHAARIPATSWTFGANTPFPVNYIFFNLIFSTIALVGGFEAWPAWKLMSGELRLLQLGLFVMAWYLVGRELLRRFRTGFVTWACAAALPLLLLSNLGLRSKFRDPVVEGFGIVLVGIAVWAALRSTADQSSRRSPFSAVAVLAVSLTVGIHFPVFAEAFMLIGAWLLVAPRVSVSGPRRERRARGRARTLVRRTIPYVIGVAAALGVLEALAGTNPLSPAADKVSPKLAFRAYLIYIGNPLSSESLADFVRARWSTAFILTQGPYTRMAIALALVAAVGLIVAALRDRHTGRMFGWWILASIATLGYVGVGFYFGRTDITPWNAVTRNAFYLWFPISLAVIFGVRGAATLIEFDDAAGTWRTWGTRITGLLLGVGLLVGLAKPFVHDLGPTVRAHGWIQAPLMSADGEQALSWVARHTPQNSVVLTSEQTFGSDIISGRNSMTEGYATLESKAVATPAVATLSRATEFFLPVHSPMVLLAGKVDYVVTVGNGLYASGQLAGVPLLASYLGILQAIAPTLSLDGLPYLVPVHRFGGVTIYHVDRSRLPSVTETRIGPGDPMPVCGTDLCLVYQRIASGTCPADQISAEPRVCIIGRNRQDRGV